MKLYVFVDYIPINKSFRILEIDEIVRIVDLALLQFSIVFAVEIPQMVHRLNRNDK